MTEQPRHANKKAASRGWEAATGINTPRGHEHPEDSSGNTANCKARGTESGTGPALKAESIPVATTPTDPDLTRLIDAWPTLPPALRAGIVAMVKASTPIPGKEAQ
ncbi:MAG: hypothetical protein K8S99_03680 [Planctomycetes bacterium]|nr:hypothetical protein [Planctomycetota bacterium]